MKSVATKVPSMARAYVMSLPLLWVHLFAGAFVNKLFPRLGDQSKAKLFVEASLQLLSLVVVSWAVNAFVAKPLGLSMNSHANMMASMFGVLAQERAAAKIAALVN